MNMFDWVIVSIVTATLIYVSFVLTLRDWLVALGQGQAVALLPEHGGRKWPLWTQIAMVVLGLALCVPLFYYGWVPLFETSSQAKLSLEILGLVIYLGGLIFVLWARRTLGRNWGISTSQQVKLLDDHQLIQSGPYAFVRHPMYFGWWVCMFGLTLVYPVWAIFLLLVFSVISFAGRARREEVTLSERFGEKWIEYKKRTKMIFPFLF